MLGLGRLLAPKDRSGGLLFKQTTELTKVSNGCAHPELIYGARQIQSPGTTPDLGTRIVAEIDLSAIVHNTREIQKRAIKSHCNLFAIVKANAYGHGAVAIAHTLACCNKIDAFGVATLAEAIELRESGLPTSVRILVLGASMPSEWTHYAEHDLDIMISSAEAAEELIQWTTAEALAGRLKRPMRAHVMLNTGMSRIGLATFSRDVLPLSTDVPSAAPSVAPSAPGVHAERAAAVIQKIHDASDAALEFVAICSHMSEAKVRHHIEKAL